MKRLAYSIMAMLMVGAEYEMHHTVGFVEAETNKAADDIAMELAHKMHPRAEGWREHRAVTIRDDAAADTPENFIVEVQES